MANVKIDIEEGKLQMEPERAVLIRRPTWMVTKMSDWRPLAICDDKEEAERIRREFEETFPTMKLVVHEGALVQ